MEGGEVGGFIYSGWVLRSGALPCAPRGTGRNGGGRLRRFGSFWEGSGWWLVLFVWDVFLFVRCQGAHHVVGDGRGKEGGGGRTEIRGTEIRGSSWFMCRDMLSSPVVVSLLEGHLAAGTTIDIDTRPGWRLTSQSCRVECCQWRGRIQFPRQRATMIWFHLVKAGRRSLFEDGMSGCLVVCCSGERHW